MKLLSPLSGYRAWHIVRIGIGIVIVLGLLLYRLSEPTGSLAPQEIRLLPIRIGLQAIVHNPLFLPLQLLRLATGSFAHSGTTVTRLPNVVAGIALLLAFTALVRMWYGARSAFFGLILLATAPWFLHLSRLALNDILFPLSLTTLLLFYSAWQRSESRSWFWLSPFVNGLLLYAPGLVWFVIIGLFWQRQEYKLVWRRTSPIYRIGWLLLWPLATSLLGYAFWRTPHLLYAWAGIPTHFPTPLHFLRSIGTIWLHIFVRGPQVPLLGLGFLPLVNVFTTTMALVGGYFYVSHWRAPRSRTLLACAVVGTVLASVGGPVSSSILLPLIFLLAAGGIGYLFHEWFKVFPRNPLAKAVGYSLLGLALTVAVSYNLHQYFVAWPHNSSTHIAFNRRD